MIVWHLNDVEWYLLLATCPCHMKICCSLVCLQYVIRRCRTHLLLVFKGHNLWGKHPNIQISRCSKLLPNCFQMSTSVIFLQKFGNKVDMSAQALFLQNLHSTPIFPKFPNFQIFLLNSCSVLIELMDRWEEELNPLLVPIFRNEIWQQCPKPKRMYVGILYLMVIVYFRKEVEIRNYEHFLTACAKSMVLQNLHVCH